jgi:hypothetical protein
MANRNRLTPATFIAANRWRVTPQDVARRFAERDQRIAADSRTEAQKYLGDPPPHRSALAQRKQTFSPPTTKDPGKKTQRYTSTE